MVSHHCERRCDLYRTRLPLQHYHSTKKYDNVAVTLLEVAFFGRTKACHPRAGRSARHPQTQFAFCLLDSRQDTFHALRTSTVTSEHLPHRAPNPCSRQMDTHPNTRPLYPIRIDRYTGHITTVVRYMSSEPKRLPADHRG